MCNWEDIMIFEISFFFLNILLTLLKHANVIIASGKFYSLFWVVDVFMYGDYFS